MNKHALIAGLIAVAVAGIIITAYFQTTRTPGAAQGCTMEAKICPDGSAVGREGPNCEFAQCPGTTPEEESVTLEARMGEQVSGLGVKITLLRLLEDSRCPTDVVCIQAGTVRLQVRISSGLGDAIQEIKLGQPVTTEAETVTLTAVSPEPKSTVQLKASDYRFTFTVAKREGTGGIGGGILPYNSGVRGTVLLGPTCPVVQEPQDPKCADKPYATNVTVRRQNSTAIVATVKSSASGAFEFSLPPGAYTLVATGGATLPRCSEKNVTVQPEAYETVILSCDTGIR